MVKLELSASLDPSPSIRVKLAVSVVSESTDDSVPITVDGEALSVIAVSYTHLTLPTKA